MASRENLPKIVRDVQDIVTDLCKEFESTKEPITDDNHNLHKLCAKLEFLLTSSSKEKKVLGGRRSYWHWMFGCLRHTRGLNDGLRYVQANKEVRTSKGKGRALIRYCLVHQTLADSFQNCIMNSSLTSQHFSDDSVLLNGIYSSAFVTSLYDLNAVNFDLISKGYDLDAGWPTFASKRSSNGGEQWALQSHVGSLGSLTSASVVMDHPQIGRLHNGSGSSGPSSVDQRIEDLVLELDQSDHKIREQQDLIHQLEMKAETLENSTGEKEEILARVITDVENKNRHLHHAMSNMSSEFEARELQWKEKYEEISKLNSSLEDSNTQLMQKMQQLENDKHNLEEMVSQQMSQLTRSFSSNSSPPSTMLTPVTSTPNFEQVDNGNRQNADDLAKNEELIAIRAELKSVTQNCAEYERRLANDAANLSKIAELQAQLSENEEMSSLFVENEKRRAAEDAVTSILKRIVPHLPQDDSSTNDPTDQVDRIVNRIISLTQTNKTQEQFQTSAQGNGSKQQVEIDSLKAENELLAIDRDTANVEVTQTKLKFGDLLTQVENLKLQLEAELTTSSLRITELEEQLLFSEEKSSNLQRHHVEMLADLKMAQESLKQFETEAEVAKNKVVQLETELKRKESEWGKEKEELEVQMEEEKSENEFYLEEIHSEMSRHATLNESIDRELEVEKAKNISIQGELNVAQVTIASFTEKMEKTCMKLQLTSEAMLEMKGEMEKLELKYQKSLNDVSSALNEEKSGRKEEKENRLQLEGKINQILGAVHLFMQETQSKDSTENPHFKTQESFLKHYTDDVSQLTVELQHSALKYQVMADDLKEKEEELKMIQEQIGCDKETYGLEIHSMEEAMKELQATVEIQQITIKDIGDKFTSLQEERANHVDEIEILVAKNAKLSQDLDAVTTTRDSLKEELSESSLKVTELETNTQSQLNDIISLKEKITELLFDKDHLWKDSQNLRLQIDELEKSVDHDDGETLDTVDWISDDDVTNCGSCDQKFSLTLRKHHCRVCGKIFCKNCSDNWLSKGDKKLRCCASCHAGESSGRGILNKSIQGGKPEVKTDAVIDIPHTEDDVGKEETRNSYEEIKDDEVNIEEEEVPVSPVQSPDKSSMYQSLSGLFTRSSSSSPIVLDVKNEDTVTIAARTEVHLPILIENEGLKLKWSISSNRDISFKLFFTLPETTDVHELIPSRRINSHVEAFEGNLVARKCGIYTIVLDNTFSKLTAKEVTYKIGVTRNLPTEA
uniref:Zinc finger protein n=1 Tax=Ciona intestinalis TaxID=7719 RepID=A0A1W5BCY4_CIOIN|nr:zinc finger protein 6 [Ciona intestinalis]XP_009860813.1 zinc finger protein 6 isoform X1 [Ciona intestinalis]FAA00159.1 TPA: zinc finger protein [Ciona intestinalis]|eukprot:NP_001041461.1 zinc finger protein 6 [Ciona intestinalis]